MHERPVRILRHSETLPARRGAGATALALRPDRVAPLRSSERMTPIITPLTFEIMPQANLLKPQQSPTVLFTHVHEPTAIRWLNFPNCPQIPEIFALRRDGDDVPESGYFMGDELVISISGSTDIMSYRDDGAGSPHEQRLQVTGDLLGGAPSVALIPAGVVRTVTVPRASAALHVFADTGRVQLGRSRSGKYHITRLRETRPNLGMYPKR